MFLPNLQQPSSLAPQAWGVDVVQAGLVHRAAARAGLVCKQGAPPGPADG